MGVSSEKWMQQLLENENEQLAKLNLIVANSIKEQKLLSQKLRREKKKTATLGERVADAMAQFGGSWYFIFIFTIAILMWIVLNTKILGPDIFDPFPFILLNLFLSTVAALQAPVIMMSQNRQEKLDREHAEHDYLINLKAEIEVRALHEKVDQVLLSQLKEILLSQQRLLEMIESRKTK